MKTWEKRFRKRFLDKDGRWKEKWDGGDQVIREPNEKAVMEFIGELMEDEESKGMGDRIPYRESF